MPEEKTTTPDITAETTLAPQFGSETEILAEGQHDQMILSKLKDGVAVPIAYFYAKPKHKGGRFARRFFANYLKLNRSTEGWGVNKMIQAIAASKGVSSGIGEIVKKPNIFARNITKRDWQEQAQRDGKTVVE